MLSLSFVDGRCGGIMAVYADDAGTDTRPLGRCAVATGIVTCRFKLPASGASGLAFRYEPVAAEQNATTAANARNFVALDWWSLH